MDGDDGRKRHEAGIGQRIEQLSSQPEQAVLQAEQHDEAERQRKDIG